MSTRRPCGSQLRVVLAGRHPEGAAPAFREVSQIGAHGNNKTAVQLRNAGVRLLRLVVEGLEPSRNFVEIPGTPESH